MAPPISPEEQRRRKIEALAKLRRLETEGFLPAEGGKGYSFATSLHELEETVSRLTAQRELDNSIKFQQNMLMGVASAIEKICEDPEWNIFGLRLQGWSETVYENITDYNDVFTELHYKYKDTISIPPEVKLLGMVAGSAWMFHMSRTAFGKAQAAVPEFNEVMEQDPELRRRYRDTAAGLAQQRGAVNPMAGLFNQPTRPPPQPIPPQRYVPPGPPPGPPPGGMGPGGMGPGHSRYQSAAVQPGPPRRPTAGRQITLQPNKRRQVRHKTRMSTRRPPMAGPDELDVDGLLSSLNQPRGGGGGGGGFSDQEAPSEIDLSEIDNYSAR
jgi:hypothetical protein